MTDSKKIDDGRPDLTSIIEKLEKAEGPSRDLDVEIMNALAPRSPDEKRLFDGKVYPATWGAVGQVCDHIRYFVEAPFLTSSTDAAVSVLNEALPGWFWRCGSTPLFPNGWAFISRTDANNALPGDEFACSDGKAATPAIALVLATLRALQSRGAQ